MITEQGQILRVAGGDAWVSCQSRVECARCAEGRGCGGGLLGRLLGDRLYEIQVSRRQGLEVGACVTIGISESALLSAAALIYLMPLLCLFAGALLGQWLAGDPAAIVSGFAAMALAYFALRLWLRRNGTPRFIRPAILASKPKS